MNPSEPDPTVSATTAADVALRHTGEGVVIAARGEFDALTTPALQEAIHDALAERPRVLVMDLSETAFFSSTAIGALVDAELTAGEPTSVRLVASPPIRRTLRLLGLDRHFDYCDTTDDALTTTPG
ncbi:STAS domain-containing protein [Amycolatopsis sp. FDAARGOS 1241]|uniref:STAS domain-containing protein n=1 Tax=Amycolatopsis sp. FDAARGOS 1241 TaxID=2778070 RepID=UPI001951D1D8|nr:STAS domain-containing protein [Amycolatopsis sp. FDAARGOS 1241]QRP49187.1 STAS domain-containing protein [Amycolatopsis sp. FDAARGOS 1241]